jgi:hypothetical protein
MNIVGILSHASTSKRMRTHKHSTEISLAQYKMIKLKWETWRMGWCWFPSLNVYEMIHVFQIVDSVLNSPFSECLWPTKPSQGEGYLYSQSHSTSMSKEKVKVWIQKLYYVRYSTLLQKFAAKSNHVSKVNESQSLQPKDSVLACFSKSTITNFKIAFSIP